MKYTLICFTFNLITKQPNDENDTFGKTLQLRNNWYEYAHNEENLNEILTNFGFTAPFYFPNSNKVVTMKGEFTIPDTRIIVHIITN